MLKLPVGRRFKFLLESNKLDDDDKEMYRELISLNKSQITRHGAMLEQKIMECTRHGITHLAVQGCYLKEDKDMLYTVLGEDEVKEVTALVHSLDPGAFINIIKSEGIAGRFYEEPLE